MQLRSATAADTDIIAAMHTDNWRVSYRGHMKDTYLDHDIFAERLALWRGRMANPVPGQHVLLALEQDEVIGFSCMIGAEDEKWGSMLDNLHVAGTHKGKGIGERLIRETALWLARHYPEQGMYLWVLEANEGARRFYDRMGGINAERDTWLPPDGSNLPCLRYVWPDLRSLTAAP